MLFFDEDLRYSHITLWGTIISSIYRKMLTYMILRFRYVLMLTI